MADPAPIPEITDPKAWKRKAMAFATRAHRHLWGKNNEDPLVFLFRHGLSNEFSKKIYLGWNKFSQERPSLNWGIQGGGNFTLPAGIVFPHIVDRELLSLFVIPMETSGGLFIVPGSNAVPGTDLLLGDPGEDPLSAGNILEGLCRIQEHSGQIRVRIPLI